MVMVREEVNRKEVFKFLCEVRWGKRFRISRCFSGLKS
jgi:hypothetical protein